MEGGRSKRLHIETLLALFRILDVESIDAETIVATYKVPFSLVNDTLVQAEQLGYLGEIEDGTYQLTPRGKRLLPELNVRGGAVLS